MASVNDGFVCDDEETNGAENCRRNSTTSRRSTLLELANIQTSNEAESNEAERDVAHVAEVQQSATAAATSNDVTLSAADNEIASCKIVDELTPSSSSQQQARVPPTSTNVLVLPPPVAADVTEGGNDVAVVQPGIQLPTQTHADAPPSYESLYGREQRQNSRSNGDKMNLVTRMRKKCLIFACLVLLFAFPICVYAALSTNRDWLNNLGRHLNKTVEVDQHKYAMWWGR